RAGPRLAARPGGPLCARRPFPTRRSSDLPAPTPPCAAARHSLPLQQLPTAGSRLRPKSLQAPELSARDASRERRLWPSATAPWRSEEHTSELQSPYDLVCRLLLEKKNSPR